jgi:hypothetical protein
MNKFIPVPVFLKEQLNHVIDLAFQDTYPALKARNFIPVNRNISNSAETVSARIWDSFGRAKILNPRADDFPKGSIEQFESYVPIKSLGTSFGYSLMDLRRSQMAGTNLDSREASAARYFITASKTLWLHSPDTVFAS